MKIEPGIFGPCSHFRRLALAMKVDVSFGPL